MSFDSIERAQEFIDLWDCLSEPADTAEELDAKALKLEPLCKRLVTNWKDWCGDECMTHYMHFIDQHLVQQVRLLSLNVSAMSAEGLENHHQPSKELLQ